METSDPFRSAPGDTHAEMMRATYDALQRYGYSDLTIQRIGDEFPKSKSLIYQHYDTKDDLLVAFLDYMLAHFESEFDGESEVPPPDRLRRTLDGLLSPTADEEKEAFTRAITALRGQATHDEQFRERFTQTDAVMRAHVTDIVRDGVDSGAFADVEPEAVADFLVTTAFGATLRRSTTDDGVAAVRAELDAYVRARLGVDW